MNRNQKLNRAKKLRIKSEKHGSAAIAPITKAAADKTPIAKRTGNYYTQVRNDVAGAKKGEGNTYMNTKAIHKLRKTQKPNSLFNVGKLINYFLVKSGFRSPILA